MAKAFWRAGASREAAIRVDIDAILDDARFDGRRKFGPSATVELVRGCIVVRVEDEIVAEWDAEPPNEAAVRY